MKPLVENRFALLFLVVVALSALFGVAHLTAAALPSSTADAEPVLAPVESTTRLCPTPQGEEIRALVAGYAPGTQDTDDGVLETAPNTADASPARPATEVGEPWQHEPEETESGTVVRAERGFAAGAEITHLTAGESGTTEARCAEPSSSTWFAAPGGTELKDLRLHLANIDETAATVNVDLYAPDGPTFSLETRGITVDPYTEVELSVLPLVEHAEAVAVHVRTNAGRVAAALYAQRSGRDADWVPATAAPATSHVIPGIPGGDGNRRLILAAVSDEPTTVQLRLLTPDGEVDAETLTDVEVAPAATTRVSLEGPMERRDATLVVIADHPVVVGVAIRHPDEGAAYTAATEPLTPGPDARAVAPPPFDDAEHALLLGAPEKAATVTLTPVEARGEQGEPLRVTVEAGSTLAPDLDPADGAVAWLVEVVEGGPVHAARMVTVDGTSSVLPLLPAPVQVPLPPVVNSMTGIVP